METSNRNLSVVVPVYRNVSLLRSCLESLLAELSESRISATVYIVNDSPDCEETSSYLEDIGRSDKRIKVNTNKSNVGFIKSANWGLKRALHSRSHCLLLNSDTEVSLGAIRIMLEAFAQDHSLGFVGPRTNSGGINTFPKYHSKPSTNRLVAEQRWRAASSSLPKLSYVPVIAGFCMLVRHEVIDTVGFLDEVYGKGYEEENDLIIRGSKLGWRCAISNEAFCYHRPGSSSFALLSGEPQKRRDRNFLKIIEQFPFYPATIANYERSANFQAEKILSELALLPGEPFRICFDMSNVGVWKNGTNVLACSVLRSAAKLMSGSVLAEAPPLEIIVVMNEAARKYHEVDHLNLQFIDELGREKFSAAIRFGQPFCVHDVDVLHSAAPVVVFGAYDTIALDCMNLAAEAPLLEQLWETAYTTANGLFFISQHCRRMHLTRFPQLDVPDYTKALPEGEVVIEHLKRGGRHVLVAGNKFGHKYSEETARLIARAYPDVTIVCMCGLSLSEKNIRFVESGTVSDRAFSTIFKDASMVVLPSLSEGFGFGLTEALLAGKVVVARSIPPVREIVEALDDIRGVFLYNSSAELYAAIAAAAELETSNHSGTLGDWDTWTKGALEFIVSLLTKEKFRASMYTKIRTREIALERLRFRHHIAPTSPVANLMGLEDRAMSGLCFDDRQTDHIAELRLLGIIEDESQPSHHADSSQPKMSHTRELQEIYRDLLGRDPDPVARVVYTLCLYAGIPSRLIRARIEKSPEALAKNKKI